MSIPPSFNKSNKNKNLLQRIQCNVCVGLSFEGVTFHLVLGQPHFLRGRASAAAIQEGKFGSS